MINSSTGVLNINHDLTLYPHQPLQEFTSRSDISSWKNIINNEMYIGYQKDIRLEQKKVNISVYFIKEILWSVDLSFFHPYEKEERFRTGTFPNSDVKRWYLHKEFLEQVLGEPPYNYSWGFVSPGYSQLDQLAIVKIEYFLPD